MSEPGRISLWRWLVPTVLELTLASCCPAARPVTSTNRPGADNVPASAPKRTIDDFGACSVTVKGCADFDSTAAIQASIDALNSATIPRGVYRVNPVVGILLRTGTVLMGAGEANSILVATPTGGSVIRREFDPDRANPYVSFTEVSRLAIVLTHPAEAAPGNYTQIAIDFRNISRSTVRDVYIGNFALDLVPGRSDKGRASSDLIQGYGIALGTRAGKDPAYCGGEMNAIRSVHIFGAKKGVAIDDLGLTSNSAAHASLVEDCDIQFVEVGVSAESRFTAAGVFRNNTIQSIQRARHSVTRTAFYLIAGMDNLIEGGYIELSPTSTDYVVLLTKTSRNNVVRLFCRDFSTQHMADLGSDNHISCF